MTILEFAQSLPDHRQQFKIRHLACDIIFITLAAVICGAQDWEDIEYFGVCKIDFFKRYLRLPHGIPSHDTFNRFFSVLDPIVMENQFRCWVKTVCREHSNLVSIDGKTICGAKQNGRSPFHMVSAFCHANGVSLGQVKTAVKSNEITAIPELLKTLDLAGCVISIDAMGCQTAIAKQIVEAKADYILAVKENQHELYQSIQDTFRFQKKDELNFTQELDFGHGRIEQRSCYLSMNMEDIDSQKWGHVQTVVKIVSNRYNKTKKIQEEPTVRYYISSLEADPAKFNSLIRSHWAIENKLHWHLDVSMGEDASRKRAENSPMNFSVVFKTALTMLQKYKLEKGKPSIKTKRKMGGWSDQHLAAMMLMDPSS